MEFDRLGKIVSSKKWDAYDSVRPDGKTMLDVIVELISPMSPPERKIATDLLDDFLVIKDYSHIVIDLLKEIVRQSKGRAIAISTVKDYKATKVKSGAALTFEMNSNIHFFDGVKFTFCEDPKGPRFQDFKGFKVLVDDFIGTGNQFLGMSEHLEEAGFKKEVDLVATIAIQQEGKLNLEKNGFNVFSVYERPKSIQALIALSGRPAEEVYEIYDGLELRVGCPDDYKRGYGQSEATVSLKKTPNNTLPIFWFQGEKKWPAPFPRPRS
ncbi:phosphoribosyltransferase [Paracoccus sp. PARArs4]|uniref:phosphoribosyltransferase n=1 Tax=Paracoccus sp. PARArs4 TaxID=2853442 RepID=UPI0024A6CC21|nr:phosphoribosyltransferase [Paracoccus sp. PARArs4]